ncbi:hypothetical protein ACLOJK_029698 [Asimina triloba]
MGNCFGRGPSTTCGCGGDGCSPDAEEVFDDVKTEDHEDSFFMSTGVEKDAAVHVPSTDQVKIKVSRKQVVELLGRVDIHGMSTHQILAHLILASGMSSQHMIRNNQRSWRPMLKSIPEVN